MLSNCVKLNRGNLNRDRTSFTNISFHLDRNNLKKIEQAQAKNRALKFSASLLSEFRDRVIIERQNYLHSGLTFCSYYLDNNRQKAAIRSVIFLDGKVNQQICHEFLQDRKLARQIISAHYWLSEQLLNQLNPETQTSFNLTSIALVLSLLAIAIFVWINLQDLTGSIVDYLILSLMFLLLQQGIKRLLEFCQAKWREWRFQKLLFDRLS
jgi:hypothetical protein